MNQTVSRLLGAYRDEFARKLAEWVKIPSVEAEAEDGAPLGREVRHMLDAAEADAKAMGILRFHSDLLHCIRFSGQKK